MDSVICVNFVLSLGMFIVKIIGIYALAPDRLLCV